MQVYVLFLKGLQTSFLHESPKKTFLVCLTNTKDTSICNNFREASDGPIYPDYRQIVACLLVLVHLINYSFFQTFVYKYDINYSLSQAIAEYRTSHLNNASGTECYNDGYNLLNYEQYGRVVWQTLLLKKT